MEWLKELYEDDFGKVLITVGGTLLVTAVGVFLGGSKDIIVEWWRRRRTRTYNAMLLATTLDQYIEDCVTVVSDDGYPMPDGQTQPVARRPKEIIFPKEIEWPAITSDVMFRCLMLPAEVRSAEADITFVSEIAIGPDGEEYFEVVQKNYASVGLAALHILNRLKDDYGIDIRPREHYDPFGCFTRKIAHFENVQKAREDANAERMKFVRLPYGPPKTGI